MAQIQNANALTVSDGLNAILNVDTLNKVVQILNGATLKLYSDGGATQTGQVNNASQSATAPAIANAGTIASAGLTESRVAPASAVTGIILAAGTLPGQKITVVNESAAANSITFNATPGTSNVADSANEQPIYGLQAREFIWDSVQALWFPVGNALINGTLIPLQSATAPAIANAGTIATANLGVSRVAPASAVTGIILAAGTIPGQLCLVVNEAAVANSLTFNTTPATANVADSATALPIFGLESRLFVWDSAQALWFPVGNPLANGSLATVQSATSPDPGAAGTIATAGVGIALVTPAAARTGIILQAGTINGQEIWVVNQGAAANTLTFNTTPATANLASSATETALAGLTARKFVWVGGASLWYSTRD